METKKLEKQLCLGQSVVYFDEFGCEHDALVTAVWGERTETTKDDGSKYISEPSCNLLFLSPDPKREDSYGRQIERRSSCVHSLDQCAWGNCYSLPEQLEDSRKKISKAKEEFANN